MVRVRCVCFSLCMFSFFYEIIVCPLVTYHLMLKGVARSGHIHTLKQTRFFFLITNV